ncbi:MAG: hypothetical protein KatS3mg092_0213 [Patescibacteria group bacterium]|nr:MAG: hypothetical protein KatS3mg092_0213 [Patescibacteria group bacterium]
MDDFFHYVSKAVIITPIIIVILALIIKFNQKKEISFKTNYPLKKEIKISITPTSIITQKIEKISISLDDHWLCQYQFNNEKYKLEINKRKINLEINSLGQIKKYDLSPYASFIESYLNMDINQLENISKIYLPKNMSLKDLVNGCKKI